MQITLDNRTALVTGSQRNTGAIIAKHLADSGARVVVHCNDAEQDAAAMETPHALAIVCGDITTTEGCESVLAQLEQAQVSVDILVNNFGSASRGKWDTTNTDDWLAMYQTNVLSAARLIQGLTPAMREQGWGRVVNLSTIGSHRPGPLMPHYYSAKGALATMGVSLMQALSGTGITVNTVSPGLIHTPDLEAGYRLKAAKKGWGEQWEEIVAHIVKEDFPNACERLAQREEVADLVTFLCSEQAAFINGQNIRIDGGAVVYV